MKTFDNNPLCAETDPELFFTDTSGPQSADARRICMMCDAFQDCLRGIDLAEPRADMHGMEAAMSVAQRFQLHRYDKDLLKYVVVLDEAS